MYVGPGVYVVLVVVGFVKMTLVVVVVIHPE